MKISTNKKSLILTILSILGLGTTTVLAVRSGMRSQKLLEDRPDANTFKDKAKITWKAYIATIISMVATGTCIVASHSLSSKQIAALSGIAATGATTFSKYRSKVREVVGEETEQQIYDAVVANPTLTVYPEVLDIEDLPNDTLFLDEITGQYFYSNVPSVLRAIYTLNRMLASEGIVTVEDWCKFVGIPFDESREDTAWYVELLMDWGYYPWVDAVIWEPKSTDGTPYKMISFGECPLSKEELKETEPDFYEMYY